MPSAANGKSEKPASSEALDNSPIRQVMTIIEHKIRNLEKRKGKLDQYRNLQKAGKDLEREQKVALTKWDEVNVTLEFSREFSKQITQIAVSAERDAKKQAKRDAWVRYAADANKIREVLLVLDCLNMMGSDEVREDFLSGTNGAAKLTKEDLRILDDLQKKLPGFHAASAKAAEHLCSITEGKGKEVLGTTYTNIKEIVGKVHGCGYFDKVPEPPQPEESNEPEPEPEPVQEQPQPEVVEIVNQAPSVPAGFTALPVPPAPAVVPAPAYPLRPLPPITLQEVEHAYFAHQYPQQRPIAEVIGSQNFFFLQESELDSPNGTPQPPMQPSPPQGIPSQTFTNQHFIPGHEQMPPQPHFAAIEHGFPPGAVIMPHMVQHPHQLVNHVSPPGTYAQPTPVPPTQASPVHVPAPVPQVVQQAQPAETLPAASPENDKPDDDWKETRSPERDDNGERRTHGQGDGQGRFRRYGGRGGGRGAPNGHGRGRGSFRQGDGYRGRDSDGYRGRDSDGYRGRDSDGYRGRDSDGYRGRNSDGYQGRNVDGNRSDNYQGRNADGYQGRQNKDRNYDRDNYQSRSRNNDDGYYGNGDTGDDRRERSRDHVENGRDGHYRDGRDRDGFKGRGRGGPRPSRPPRTNNYPRKQDE
ncbi:Glycosyl-phosphatidyl-inositol-anchored protein [Operophtera brumata]|uniref:Glycosyl-phosphatidyl-inositol-anchored protein n=1 Tax=Operophtera brumata TaxID=104452 RepID=A0A0L7LN31_OPEBR|nr:Glycosyl-phosphatidyl-inositol-anchored protein [Operophtera brumata]